MRVLLFAGSELLKRAEQTSGGGTDLSGGNVGSIATRGINAFLLVIGAVAVIMLILGGLRYVVSGGDPKATQDAKNSILYALVGVIITMAAWAVVNFVTTRF